MTWKIPLFRMYYDDNDIQAMRDYLNESKQGKK